MPEWEYWIGPLIAVVLAYRLRPAHLVVLGLIALAGFVVSFNTAQQLYPDCEGDCPRTQHVMVSVNTILLTLVPAFLLLGLIKLALTSRLRGESDRPASKSGSS